MYKNIRTKRLSSALAFCILLNVFCTQAFAANIPDSEEQIIYYEDGSYAVITIIYGPLPAISTTAAAKKTSGTKEYTHYSSTDQPLWTFRVHGSFEYDGRSAEATSASYSQEIYDSLWSFVSADAYCSGASAVARGTFKQGVFPGSTTVTLTCSKDGKLS